MNHRNINDYLVSSIEQYTEKSDKLKRWLMRYIGITDDELAECLNNNCDNYAMLSYNEQCMNCKKYVCDDCRNALSRDMFCYEGCGSYLCNSCISNGMKSKFTCFFCGSHSCYNCISKCKYCDINICYNCSDKKIYSRSNGFFRACSFCYIKFIVTKGLEHNCHSKSTCQSIVSSTLRITTKKGVNAKLAKVVVVPNPNTKNSCIVICSRCNQIESIIDLSIPDGKTLKDIPKSTLDNKN